MKCSALLLAMMYIKFKVALWVNMQAKKIILSRMFFKGCITVLKTAELEAAMWGCNPMPPLYCVCLFVMLWGSKEVIQEILNTVWSVYTGPSHSNDCMWLSELTAMCSVDRDFLNLAAAQSRLWCKKYTLTTLYFSVLAVCYVSITQFLSLIFILHSPCTLCLCMCVCIHPGICVETRRQRRDNLLSFYHVVLRMEL